MAHAPPVVRLAFAFTAGVAWGLFGVPSIWAPLAAGALLAWPIRASTRPTHRLAWLAIGACGLLTAETRYDDPACRPAAPDVRVALEGRFLASPRGGSAPFRSEACPPVTVVVRDSGVPAGRRVRVMGRWREGSVRPWFAATDVHVLPENSVDRALEWRAVRWRDGLVRRIERLYGPKAPLVAALTLARAEGIDPAVREAFARVGISHLLAISGFHVAVIAGVVLVLLRAVGLRSRASEFGAVSSTWAYVGLIGFPDPAVRAAIMLTVVALARLRGRPVARWGPIATAWLLLLAADPRRITAVGFQLSFAGVAGLIAWAGPLTGSIRRLGRRRLPEALASGLGAGIAATLATLPIVAWHFERLSLVGVPMTLMAAPLVSVALVGALGSLAADFLSPPVADFLAGGVAALLVVLEAVTETAARWPWASVWTTRASVAAGTLGLAVASHLATRPRIGASTKRLMIGAYAASCILAWPMLLTWQARGTAGLLMIDVGQGDAIAVRSPRGRWLLVDAGPPARGSDPEAHAVVRALRARGVRRLEALVLTHADLDHIGGATAVLAAFDVGAVLDPAFPAPKADFVTVLGVAEARGVPWRAARSAERIVLDDVVLTVLHPPRDLPAGTETNETSVVVHLAFGAFDALLTGDAYKADERSILPALAPVEVLKVGHHGSDTSTDSLLLHVIRPELALISVGRSNRYGHPAPQVLGRLERGGVRVLRTDRHGTLSVLARTDGRYSTSTETGDRREPTTGERGATPRHPNRRR